VARQLPRNGLEGLAYRRPGRAVQDVDDSDYDARTAVLPFDWPWNINETIWPCRRCGPWRAELFLVGPDGAVWVREWHAVDCPAWVEIELGEQ